jgi:hypothetical protein
VDGRREEQDVAREQLVSAEEGSPVREPVLEPVKRIEHAPQGSLVGLLFQSPADRVDAC